jgi:MFS family permease
VRGTTDRESRRNARIYLVGLGASALGDNAMSLVAGIWVKELTGSSSLAAITSVCVYAPSLLGPVAGMIADRVRRRPLLVAVNLAAAALMLPLLLVHSPGQAWLIYVAMTGYGCAAALIDPAESGLFVTMLPTPLRQRMNGFRMAIGESGKLVAPLLGAGLFVVVGGGLVAALDAATFLVAVFALLLLRVHEPAPQPPERHWRVELVAGFAHLWHTPPLRAVVIAGALAMAITGVAEAGKYGLVDALHRPASFLGLITGALGAGSIIAGLVSGALIRRAGERRLVLLGLLNGVAGTVLRMIPTVPTALLGGFVLGFALPWTIVGVINLMQRETPDALQGRAAAAVTLALFGPLPLTQAIGALAIAHLDYRVLYGVTALATLSTAIWLARRD